MSHLSEDRFDELVAHERSREHPPLNNWETIAARAREEGLIAPERRNPWAVGRPWMQAAAAILLLVGGIAIGRTTALLPDADESRLTGSGGASAGQLASGGQVDSLTFRSVAEAYQVMNRAGAEYVAASAFLAANNSTNRDSSAIYQARLNALDKVVSATQTAFDAAPYDPVISQYYLATTGALEATRQQLRAQPASLRLRGF